MANFFDQFDDQPAPKASGAKPAADGGNFFDRFDESAPKGGQPAGEAPSAVGDVVQSAGAGIIRGAAGLPDLPQTVLGLTEAGIVNTGIKTGQAPV